MLSIASLSFRSESAFVLLLYFELRATSDSNISSHRYIITGSITNCTALNIKWQHSVALSRSDFALHIDGKKSRT
jgi:hypothetical protein